MQMETSPDGAGEGAKRVNERRYLPWSADEDARLLADFRAGETVADLADRHGRSPGAISSRLLHLGMVLPRHRQVSMRQNRA